MHSSLKPIRNYLIRSPFHRVGLEIAAKKQLFHYSQTHAPFVPSAFAIGMFKTGTLSISNMMGCNIHEAHEPDAYLFSKMWLKKNHGKISNDAWSNFLIKRSNALRLHVEASGFLITETLLLADLFPQSKFILTVREPKEWIVSLLRHILRNRQLVNYHYWEPIFELYFPRNDFQNEERTLAAMNLYPLESMLRFWENYNRIVINTIPKERLLILETKKLSHSIGQLESFLKMNAGSLSEKRSHAQHWKADKTEDFNLSEDYLLERCEKYTNHYMTWTSKI